MKLSIITTCLLCAAISQGESTLQSPAPDKAVPLISEGIPLSESEIPYGVADKYWDVNLGSQRAVVRMDAPAPAVRVHLPWRMQCHAKRPRFSIA